MVNVHKALDRISNIKSSKEKFNYGKPYTNFMQQSMNSISMQ